MRITVKQLKQLIREAVEDAMQGSAEQGPLTPKEVITNIFKTSLKDSDPIEHYKEIIQNFQDLANGKDNKGMRDLPVFKGWKPADFQKVADAIDKELYNMRKTMPHSHGTPPTSRGHEPWPREGGRLFGNFRS